MRDGWRETTLGEVATQHIDGFSVLPDETYTNLGVQWYAGGTFARDPKRGSDMKATRLFRVKPGQFIYNRMFVTEGSFALVSREHADGVVSNEFPAFNLDEAQILPEYLLAYFQQPKVWRAVADEATGTTKSRRRWKEAQFLAHSIALPPFAEQRRIVDLIAAVDDAVEAAEGEAAASLHSWREASRSSRTGTRKVAIGDLVSTAKSGGTPTRSVEAYYGGSIPWLKSGEVRGREIVDTEEHISEAALAGSSAWMVPAGAVLIAMYGATAGQVGQTAAPLATNQAVLALVADTSVVSQDLLFHIVASAADDLKAKAVGAAQPNISKQIVVAHEVAVPPVEDQASLANALSTALAAADAARATAESLRTLRSNLLTVLLSGEHEIPASYDALLGEVA